MRSLALAAAVLLAAGCAARAPHPQAFSFAVMGDTQYNEREEAHFATMMEAVGREPLAFVIHVGDFKRGSHSPCTDELYERRKSEFGRSAHPFILVPGDNEWTDCRRPSNGGMDPLERLSRMRQVFFAEDASLGRRRIALASQRACLEPPVQDCGCSPHPENRRWAHAGVSFVTLNIQGSEDNWGHDRASDEEARCRREANRRWLEGAVRAAAESRARALVVAIQANPWESRRPDVYEPFLGDLEAAARSLAVPVLLVHGDTHQYRIDAVGDAAGRPIPRLTRLETFGSPVTGWVKVTVRPEDPEVFGFEPRIVALAPRD